jgi:hypothetical protein
VKKHLLAVCAIALLSSATAIADVLPPRPRPQPKAPPTSPPPQQPQPKPKPDANLVVAGVTAAAGIALAGVWLARTRRRVQLQG